MNESVAKLLEKIRELEQELEDELHERAEELRYKIQNGRVVFEHDMLVRHHALKTNVLRYIKKARVIVILTAPFIYAVIIPLALLDIVVTLYQFICFPVYRIPKVRRRDYMIFDRVKLKYLNGIEKFNCLYCSYGNGIIAYTQEIAARTEQYWCPIKHAQKTKHPHNRYHLFTDFGDGDQYRDKLSSIQKDFNDSSR